MKMSKTSLVKEIARLSWKTLGTAKRGEIAKEYAKFVMRSTYSEETKVELLVGLSTIGWALKSLEKDGYGYNTAAGGKWNDSAGRLNKKNSNTFWVYS
jgi:hypothetical protein